MGEKEIQKRHNRFWSFFGFFGVFNNFFRGQVGFTLVELLVVIGVIGILVVAALAILNPFAQIQKGNDAKRKGDLAQIQKALETHYHDVAKYPASTSDYKILYNGKTVDWGSNSLSPYMSILPQDPKKNINYVYFASSDQQSYFLYAYLERNSDPQLCKSETSGRPSPCKSFNDNGIPSTSCGSGFVCNFGVSSSNQSP